jgi:hypothetical protein
MGSLLLQVTEANVLLVVMFRFFPIAVAGRLNVDEQAFIFAPEFRVRVAQPIKLAGYAVANPSTGAARKQKVLQSFQADLPCPTRREKRIPFARDPNQS